MKDEKRRRDDFWMIILLRKLLTRIIYPLTPSIAGIAVVKRTICGKTDVEESTGD